MCLTYNVDVKNDKRIVNSVTELLKRQFYLSLQMNIRLSKIAIDIAFAKSVISVRLIVNTVI